MSNIVIDIAAEFTGAKALKKADTGMDKLGKSAKKLGAAFGVAFSTQAIVGYIKAASLAAAADQKSQKLLTVGLKNLGLAYANVDSEKFIADLQKQTTILDDELRPAYAQLARTTGSIAVTQKLMTVAFDAANGASLTYAQTVDILSQAYVGNKKGLKQLNLGLTTAQLAAMSFSDILTVITDKFTGAGAQALTGYAGDMAKLKVAISDANEVLGSAFLNTLKNATGGGTIDKFTSKIELLSKAFAVLIDMKGNLDFTGFLGFPVLKKTTFNGQQSPGERAAIDKAAVKAQKAAEALLVLERKKAAAAAEARKAKRDSLALDKASLALAAGQDIFNNDAIQVQAALMAKQVEINKLGISATDAQRLGIANDVIRLTIKQDIMALEKAIAAGDAEAATAVAKKLNADMAILATLQKQEFKMIDIQKILDSLKTKDLINLANLNSALDLLKLISALLAGLNADTNKPIVKTGLGSKVGAGISFNPTQNLDRNYDNNVLSSILAPGAGISYNPTQNLDRNYDNNFLSNILAPTVTGNYAGGSTFLANKLDAMDATSSYSSPYSASTAPIIIQITSDAAKLVDVIQAATQDNVRYGNNLSYAGAI